MTRSAHLTSIKRWPESLVTELLDEALGLPGPAPVYALAGAQGSGKSTLAAQMTAAARTRGRYAVSLSIDDFYLPRRQRLLLGRSVHPLLATRGPPGTHEIELACRTLDALRALQPGQSARLPRFDKLADRRLPPSRWTQVTRRPDLIVFEGWFLKVPPEPESALSAPLNTLEREEDPDGVWRKWCNHALASYAPLWRRLDRLLFLQAPGFEVVPGWRWQQECAMQAAHPRQRAMTRAEVERFVQRFERITRQALRTLPEIAERTLRLDAERRPLSERC